MLAQVHHQNRRGIDALLKRMEAVILKNPAASQNQLNDFLDRLRSMEKELKPNPKTEVERTRPAENGRPVLYYLISVMENIGTPNHPVWQRKAWLIPKEFGNR
ncbi:hypothetical protein A2781_04940 [Candidatus Gottesmanbacteria bacterium RIFCSPHIGHO2_01_FULL_42_27]|uniref:Uncharacterized protein n=2 Tax=Candidatus Gottesmaniibacteriota TaxID=1752720 RepID=A0A1F6BDV3_9BACT|nr:MAG: hypothetical protein UV09_C0002G0057 [Candidatus Gottesmanbacteria bacterium GW2011_GWA2_42_18]KKS73549.1 MAG: hypothetical protein UV46_C0070G0003 [Candidatus Gottesmanbacteria bacterium GW2011_GWC2_42_8]OGG12233.1 MAG: hypothetical protein A2781_04940 [Candidatus Gottesmanbacteria bacterium RIFCSPHIGHO2_01_FULL_42_27]OGG21721.1 MAG: hypothetical protein A3E72_04605 [Candidatus Gottesmanbacteria bacterium RIFCSPHIGHO2_12_FULL_43_26]OGG34720.1 MAG: hypothetical protein A3G68_01630 [Cand